MQNCIEYFYNNFNCFLYLYLLYFLMLTGYNQLKSNKVRECVPQFAYETFS